VEMKDVRDIFKSKSSKIKTDGYENEKVRDGLKVIDDMKDSLSNLCDYLKNFTKKGRVCAQEESTLSGTIRTFSEKEKEVPVPFQSGDSCFVLGMEKFSEVITDVSVLELEFMTEVDNLTEQIQSWIKQELQEKTKGFKKRFDTLKAEYEKGLAKVTQLREAKVIKISSLYLGELELANLKHEYEEATIILENHCDDTPQKVNYFVIEQLLSLFNSHKKLIGYSYSYVDDIKDYIKELNLWCQEEEQFFISHFQSRTEKRDIIHKDQEDKYIFDFIQVFNNSDLVQAIGRAVDSEFPTNQLLPLVAGMFRGYQIEVPDFLSHESNSETGEPALRNLQSIIRENFDAIGNKLIEEGKKDALVLLGQVLSQLEKPTTTK